MVLCILRLVGTNTACKLFTLTPQTSLRNSAETSRHYLVNNVCESAKKIAIKFNLRFLVGCTCLHLWHVVWSCDMSSSHQLNKHVRRKDGSVEERLYKKLHYTANLNFLFLSLFVYLLKNCYSQFFSKWKSAEPVF